MPLAFLAVGELTNERQKEAARRISAKRVKGFAEPPLPLVFESHAEVPRGNPGNTATEEEPVPATKPMDSARHAAASL